MSRLRDMDKKTSKYPLNSGGDNQRISQKSGCVTYFDKKAL